MLQHHESRSRHSLNLAYDTATHVAIANSHCHYLSWVTCEPIHVAQDWQTVHGRLLLMFTVNKKPNARYCVAGHSNIVNELMKLAGKSARSVDNDFLEFDFVLHSVVYPASLLIVCTLLCEED